VFVVDKVGDEDGVFGADSERLSDNPDGEKFFGIVGICTEAEACVELFVGAFGKETGFALDAFDALGGGGNLDC